MTYSFSWSAETSPTLEWEAVAPTLTLEWGAVNPGDVIVLPSIPDGYGFFYDASDGAFITDPADGAYMIGRIA